MKKKWLLISLLFLISCSAGKKNIIDDGDVKRKPVSFHNKTLKAFHEKLKGDYSASYNLFKELINAEPDNIKNFIYLNVMQYMAYYQDLKIHHKEYLETLKNRVSNPFLYDYIQYNLMLQYLIPSPEKAETLYNHLGFVNHFYVLGPFKNENRSGMDRIFPPESIIDLNQKYKNSAHHLLEWRKIKIKSLNGINLRNYFTPDENGIAYLLTYIKVTNAGSYDMMYSSDDGIKIWIDDQLIADEDIYRGISFEQNRKKIFLDKGIHKILIKSSQERGDWKLFFRILPRDYINITDQINNTFIKREQVLSTPINPEKYEIEKLFPDDFSRGFYYFITKNYPDYERLDDKYFGLCVKEEPNNPIYSFYYSLCQKEKTLAKEYYIKSLQSDPDNVEALFQLGLYYFNLKNYDRAMEYFRTVLKKESSFHLATYYIGLVLYQNGFYHQSKKHLNTCLKKNIKKPDTLYYLANIEWILKNYKKAYHYYSQSFYDDPIQYRLTYNNKLINYLVANNQIQKIDEIIQHSFNFNREDVNLFNNFSKFYLNKGDKKKALSLIQQSLQYDSYHPGTLALAADISLSHEKTNSAIKYLEKIVENDIHNKDIKRRLQFLKKETSDIKKRYIPDITSIPKKIFRKSNKYYTKTYPDKSGIIHQDNTIIQVSQNGALEKLITKIYYVVNENGIKHFRLDSVDYNPDYEYIEIKSAKTVYRDGQEFDAFNVKDYSLINENEKLYYKYNRKMVSFPKIKKDSVIVFQYALWSKNKTTFNKSYFSDTVLSAHFYPLLNKEYIVILPKNLNLLYTYRHMKRKPKLSVKTVKKKKVYHWKFSKPALLEYEQPMPPVEDISPMLMVSTFSKWDEIGEWIWKLSEEGLSINKDMQNFVHNIKNKYTKQEDQIETLYNFVRDKIRYVGIEYGLGSIKPRNAISVWSSRYGDCKDKSLLLVTLLKELNIKAYMGLVRTLDRGEENFKLPYLGAFNHAICVIPLKKKNLFLDGTANYFNIDEFPSFDRKNRVFLVNPNGYKFVKPPKFKPSENRRISVISNIIKDDYSQISRIKGYRYGQFMPSLRYYANNSETHHKNIELYWNSIFPGTLVSGLTYHIDQNMFTYQIEIDTPFVVFDNQFKIKGIMDKVKLYKQYCTSKLRRYKIIFEFPYEYKTKNIYHFKFNVKKVNLPKNKAINNKYVFYKVTFIKKENKIIIKRTINLKAKEIQTDEYLSFKETCKEIDKWENKEIEVSL